MFNFLRRKSKEEKALHSINSGAWSRVLEPFSGAWQQNIEVHLDSVLAYPAIFSCISLISADIAKMPISVKHRQSNGIWVNANNPALSPLLIKPNFYQTSMQFFELWMISKLAHGNAYILKLRDDADRVRQLRVLDPRRVIPYIADDGEIFYSVLTDELNGLSGGLFVPARELIHDRFNTLFHPLCGLSPVYASGLAAVGGEAMLRNSAHTFKNGGKPGGIIVVPGSVDQDKAKEIKDNWNAGYTGENAGKTALLADGASFVAVSQTATDSQLVEQLNLSNQLVASTFRVPLYKIDTGQTPSYNNIEALEQAYYSQCLQVHMTAIEALIADTFSLDEQTCVEFDHSRLLRMDTAARYKSYGDGIGAGFLAPNEARIKENMPPVEGGDTPYLQQQNYSLEALAKRDAQDNPFAAGTSSPSAPETPSTEDDNTPPANDNEASQSASADDQRHFAFLLSQKNPLLLGNLMISEREASFAEIIRQNIAEKAAESLAEMHEFIDPVIEEKDKEIRKQQETISNQSDAISNLMETIRKFGENLELLLNRFEAFEKSLPDESAIISRVYSQIETPKPETPDFKTLINEELKKIKLPEPEPLPDIAGMVRDVLAETPNHAITHDEISALIDKAILAISFPEPKPVEVPDVVTLVNKAVLDIELPKPEPLPDIQLMVNEAVSAIEIPKPQPLPDVKQLVDEAVSHIVLPSPEPLPDIEGMINTAVAGIAIPQPEPLPDIKSMVKDAVDDISLPEPEPLPDIAAMVKEAVSLIKLPETEPLPDIPTLIKEAIAKIDIPQPEPLPDLEGMVLSAVKQSVSAIEIPEPESLPDINAMVRAAVNDIELPKPETLPDIEAMIQAVVREIELPQPQPLPDIEAMVKTAVSQIDVPKPEPLPDIVAMVKAAVAEIEIPQPEPLPDIGQLISDEVSDAIAAINLPKPEPLPDIDKMVLDAVESVLLPVMVQGDEVRSMVEDAVSAITIPQPEPLPDIEAIVKTAIASIEIPQPKEPEPLPDIQAMVTKAVAEIELPEPVPVDIPDFSAMIQAAVIKEVADIELPEPGKKGEDGKDGLQIEVIPDIDMSKSYPRGTYALHNGGLWRAYQKTAGINGWECVVNGLNDIQVNQKDERQFTVTLSKSNGESEEKSFVLPVMIYRDVYQPGRKYMAGDCVTFGGSIWHCYADTSDRPNEAGSSGWRLAVKRGRDGRG